MGMWELDSGLLRYRSPIAELEFSQLKNEIDAIFSKYLKPTYAMLSLKYNMDVHNYINLYLLSNLCEKLKYAPFIPHKFLWQSPTCHFRELFR
jgi:hypothetical protein